MAPRERLIRLAVRSRPLTPIIRLLATVHKGKDVLKLVQVPLTVAEAEQLKTDLEIGIATATHPPRWRRGTKAVMALEGRGRK